MLYVFAGFPGMQSPPGRYINAGGLQHCIESVEELGLLEHDPSIQARKEGLFIVSRTGAEQIADLKIHLSDRVEQTGITDNWFSDNMAFGNGVTCMKTSANYETKLINHECGRTLEQLLRSGGIVDLSKLKLQKVHDFTEGWAKYEHRWRAGSCPNFTHVVHLTAMLTKHDLPSFAYRRILEIVEEAAQPLHLEAYNRTQHFSTSRRYDGNPTYSKLVRGVI